MDNLTYSGKGQIESPQAKSIDPSTVTLSVGGARVVQILMAFKQVAQLEQNLQLAQNYYNVNLTDFTFWDTTYNPKMLSALTEGMQRPYYTTGNFTPQYGSLDYDASTGRGQSKATLSTDREWFNTRRRMSKYAVGMGRRVDYKFAMARFNSELEGWNIGFRYEDSRKMVYDEQRHTHQAEILNLGIGAGNAARQGLATSVQTLSEARSEKASSLGAFGNGLGRLAGKIDVANTFKQESQKNLATSMKSNDSFGGMDVIQEIPQRKIDKISSTG